LDGHCRSISRHLKTPEAVSKTLNLIQTQKRIQMFLEQLQPNYRNVSEIYADLEGLHRSFVEEICLVNFVFIPTDKLKYFGTVGNGALFGVSVHNNFPLACADIKDAGDCLSADLHDAAAFHLLRAVETGLRSLARHLKVPFPKIPLDYVGWDGVVKAIDVKLEKKIPTTRGPKKSAALKFKRDMLVDFKAFEAPRNELLHGRLHYNEEEAVGLFNRVREFMQRLDAQIFPPQKPSRQFIKRFIGSSPKSTPGISAAAAASYADSLVRESDANFGEIGSKMVVPKKI
jgi:hypothetical protein